MNQIGSFLATCRRLHSAFGRILAWLVLLMALTVGVIVVLRTLLGWGNVALQESVTYMHAALFMLALGFAAQKDAHVRVDIFYRRFSPLTKAWVNAVGTLLFTLPFAVLLLILGFDFAWESWAIRESSINAGGIPAVFLLKSLIPLSGLLLTLWCFSELAMQLMVLMGFEISETER